MAVEPQRDEEFRRFAASSLTALVRSAYLLVGDRDLAQDAVQGTMLRVHDHWADARRAPVAYSRQTLINICRDYWRRQHRRPREVLVSGDGSIGAPDPALVQIEDRETLVWALGELPQLRREVLVMRFFGDFSVGETAQVLQIPEGTVKSSTSRGLQELRLLLESAAEEEAC